MKAIILAGGLGTRLKSIAYNIPKPMVQINGKPFLSILMDYLIEQGISEVTLAVGYLKEKVIEYFKDEYKGIKVYYSFEEKLLGTGGSILKALNEINTNESIFVINGDTFCSINYQEFYNYHLENKSKFSMALKEINDTSRYGTVEFGANCMINKFLSQKEVTKGWINAGIYLINKSIFDNFSLPAQFSFETDFMQKYTKQLSILAFIVNNYFIDIGIPEDYEKFCKISV